MQRCLILNFTFMQVYTIVSSEKRYYVYNAEGVRVAQSSTRAAIDKFLVDAAFSSNIKSFKISYTENPDVRIVTIH